MRDDDFRLLFIMAGSFALATALVGAIVLIALLFRPAPLIVYGAPPATMHVMPLTPTPTARLPIPCGEKSLTLAVLGADERDTDYRRFRADAILLVKVRTDGLETRIGVLGLPRDLVTTFYEERTDRLNTAWVWAEVDHADGFDYFREGLRPYGLSTDHYILVNFAAFVAGVDALGGIDIDVPERIDDPDYPGGSLVIEAGAQHMDGAMALAYARTRKADTDLKRVERQVQVAQAIAWKLIASGPTLERIEPLLGSISTDLGPTDLAWLLCAAQNFTGAPQVWTITSTEARVAWLEGVGWVRQPTSNLQPFLDTFLAW